MAIKRIIEGKIYNTETAHRICTLECGFYPGDFGYHDTYLYRTKKGTYFIAGKGNAASMWSDRIGNGRWPGRGLRVIDAEDARSYAEAAHIDIDDMLAAGFEITEA